MESEDHSQTTGTTIATPSSLDNSLVNDPNFAIICSFIEKFGEICHIGLISFSQLQEMLENTNDVPLPLVQLHIRLLRRVFKSINTSKWEKSVSKFAHLYNSQDGWEVERFGYKKSKVQTKLRILKNLLESQFDYNPKFKGEVNKLPASDLRTAIAGRDAQGHCYWYQFDVEANLRVYREDVEGETWEIVASTREELEQLIVQLRSGQIRKSSVANDAIEEDEDTNGLEVEILKDILLDTGKLLEEEDDMDMASGGGCSELSDESNSLEIAIPNDDDDHKEPCEPSGDDNRENYGCQPNSALSATLVEASNMKKKDIDNNSSDLVIAEPSSSSPPKSKMEIKVQDENQRDCVVNNTPIVPDSSFKSTSLKESSTKYYKDENSSIPSSLESAINSAINVDIIVKNEKLGGGEGVNDDVVKIENDTNLHNTSTLADESIMDKVIKGQRNTLKSQHSIRMEDPSEIKIENKSVEQTVDIKIKEETNVLSQQADDIKTFIQQSNISETCSAIDSLLSVGTSKQEVEKETIPIVAKTEKKEQHLHKDNKEVLPSDAATISPYFLSSSNSDDHKTSGYISAQPIQNSIPSIPSTPPFEIHERIKSIESSCTKDERETQQLVSLTGDIMQEQNEACFVGEPSGEKSVVPHSLSDGVLDMNHKLASKLSQHEENFKSSQVIPTPEDDRSNKVKSTSAVDATATNASTAIPLEIQMDHNIFSPYFEKIGSDAAKIVDSLPESVKSNDNLLIQQHESLQGPPSSGIIIPDVSSVDKPQPNNIGNNSDISRFSHTEILTPNAPVVAQKFNAFNIDSMLRRRSTELPEKSLESHMNLAEEKVEHLPTDRNKTSPDPQVEPTKCTQPAELTEDSNAELHLTQKEEVTVDKKLSSILPQPSDVEPCVSQPGNSDTIIQTEKIISELKYTQEPEKVVDGNKDDNESFATENKTIVQEVQLENSNLSMTENSDMSLPKEEKDSATILMSTSPATDNETVNNYGRGCSESQPQFSHSLSTNSTENIVVATNDDTVSTTQPDQGTVNTFSAKNHDNSDDTTTTATDSDTTTKPASISCSVQNLELSEPNQPVKNEKVGSLGLVGYDCSSSEEEDSDNNKDVAKSNENIVPSSSSSVTGDNQNISTLLGEKKSVEGQQALLAGVCAPTSETEKDKTANKEHLNSTGKVELIPGNGGQKRKLEEEPDSTSDEQQDHPHQLKTRKISCSDNPIVGETIEEDVFFVTGTGEGALNEGGNETPSPTGALLPPSTEDLDMSGDQLNSTAETDKNTPPVKQKGRGRPRKNPPKEVLKDKNVSSSNATSPETTKKNRRNSSTDEINGLSSSVRRSGRVAQIRQKEEEERRKLEEERLAQLKAAQLRKKQKQLERELKAAKGGGEVPIKPPKPPKAPKTPKTPKAPKTPKTAGKVATKPKSGSKQVTYIPPSSDEDSETEEEAEDEVEEYSAKPGKKRRKKRAKNGKALKRGAKPWLHSSEESEDEAVEEEEEHYEEEEEEEELIFNKSDHEFSPESDLEDTEFSPSRHARTAKQKEQAVDKYAETYCEKCAKGDHPEWILLCDSCDHGWHASCVYPQLWVIPEGEWFCPKCSQRMLVEKLSENLVEFDKLLKKRENEVLRKQRLAYVGISLNNVLPSAEKPTGKSEDEENGDETHKSRKSRRRRNYSDEEIGGFINDNDDDDSSSGSGSSYESDDEPMYQLRARRATKGFSFQEYDEMINTALGDDSADGQEAQPLTSELGDEVPADVENSVNENGEEAKVKPVKISVGGGKRMPDEDDSEEEDLDEKEKNRRKMLNQNQRKSRRRLNDLDATSEEDSDEDFKGSGGDDDEEDEDEVVEDDSEWSDGDESDDSIAIAKLTRKKKKHRRGPLGRQEKYLDDGETVRRSTRRRKSRVIYDESDQEEDEDDQTEKWQSGESDVSEEEEEDESESESDDETWGKKKKQKKQGGSGSKLPNFFLGGSGPSILKKPKKKKKRRVDDDDVDRAWTNKFGSKVKKLAEEPVERKTRGRQINFKDILDSGESDDDGNIRPKRRRILSDDSDDDDDEMPGSSRKLVEEIKAANAKAAAEEKLKHEEKLREMAVENKKLESENIQVKPLPIISDLPPAIPEPEKEEERPVKITNSIVESILMRKTPSPVTSPLPPPPSIINEEPYVPPSISGIMPGPLVGVPPYLATVLAGGGGSARVGKKKVSASMMPTPVSQSGDVLPFPSSSSKKSSGVVSIPVPPKPLPGTLASSSSPGSPLSSSSIPRSTHPPNIPSELSRIATPMYANNPALIRSFTPWGRSPPPYAGPPNLGKPPPLNSSSFMPQPGQLRPPSSSYSPSPPPTLRIPNPNTLQAFQQFSKRSADVGGPHYRMPHQISSVLPSMTRERIFLGGSSPYASYGMLPPQSQQHPALFAPPFDYRAAESFKEELLERHSQQLHPPLGPPTTLASAHSLGQHLKDEMNHPPTQGTQGDGEFGGLVSYFSSQHSNDED